MSRQIMGPAQPAAKKEEVSFPVEKAAQKIPEAQAPVWERKYQALKAMRDSLPVARKEIIEFSGARTKEEQEYALRFYENPDLVISCVGIREPGRLKQALKGVHESLPDYCRAILEFGEEAAEGAREIGIPRWHDVAKALAEGKRSPEEIRRLWAAEPEMLAALAEPGCSIGAIELGLELARETGLKGEMVVQAALAFQKIIDYGEEPEALRGLVRRRGAQEALSSVAGHGLANSLEAERLGFKNLSFGATFVGLTRGGAKAKGIDYDAFVKAALEVVRELEKIEEKRMREQKTGEKKMGAPKVDEKGVRGAYSYLLRFRGKRIEENSKFLVDFCSNSGDAAACLEALERYTPKAIEEALTLGLHPLGGVEALEAVRWAGLGEREESRILNLCAQLTDPKKLAVSPRLQGKAAQAFLNQALIGGRVSETDVVAMLSLVETAIANRPEEMDYLLDALAKFSIGTVEAARYGLVGAGMSFGYLEHACKSLETTGAQAQYDPKVKVETSQVYSDEMMRAIPEIKLAMEECKKLMSVVTTTGTGELGMSDQALLEFLRPKLADRQIHILEKTVPYAELEGEVAEESAAKYLRLLKHVAGVKTGEEPRKLEGEIPEERLREFCRKTHVRELGELEARGAVTKGMLLEIIRPRSADAQIAELKETQQDYLKLLKRVASRRKEFGEEAESAAQALTYLKVLLDQEGLVSRKLKEGEKANGTTEKEMVDESEQRWAVPQITKGLLSELGRRLDAAEEQKRKMEWFGVSPQVQTFDSEIRTHVPIQRNFMLFAMTPKRGELELPKELALGHPQNAIAYARAQREYDDTGREIPYVVGGQNARLIINVQSDIPQAHDPKRAMLYGDWEGKGRALKKMYDDWERVLVMGLMEAASEERIPALAFPTPSILFKIYPELNSDTAFRIYAETLQLMGGRLAVCERKLQIQNFRGAEAPTDLFLVIDVKPKPLKPAE